MSKPIRPNEVSDVMSFPDEVIDGFNTLIAKNWDGKASVFLQKDVVKEIRRNFVKSGKRMDSNQIFEKNYLDVEETYRLNGWKVEYDKPAYNETYEASFKFSKK
jgi:hypothetical protein